MKNLYVLTLILTFPVTILAQTIHGLWSGTLVNDSTHRTQNFELGLSEYRGKITGYTYTTFIENDTFYYSVKRIKAERKDGKLVIEDVEMVGNNFPERAAKHVKQVTTFPLINDTTIDITKGRWATNQTKKYYSIGGSAAVKEQEEEKESDLLAHLTEMKVKNDIVVNRKEEKRDAVAKKVSPKGETRDQQKTSEPNTDVVKNSKTLNNQPTDDKDMPRKETSPEVRKDPANSSISQGVIDEVKTVVETSNTQKPDNTPSVATDLEKTAVSSSKTQDKTDKIITANPTVADVSRTNPQPVASASGNSNNIVNQPLKQRKAPEQKPTVSGAGTQTSKPPATVNTPPALAKTIDAVAVNAPTSQRKEAIEKAKELPTAVAQRKNESIQDIYFKNDSLVLSLYDNGIVDGDTVSVFVNGETVISKQKLKEAAIKQTIYVSSQTDSVQLVLFAENLGTIPPNTGLLTVRDGNDVYQVRFSADLQKNASLFLRRKKD